MCRSSRLTKEGRREVVMFASQVCGGRGSVGMRGAGRAACVVPVSPRPRADDGAVRLRLARKFPASSTGLEKLRRHGGPCVRQNRVVLAVVATVKSFAKVRASPTGKTASSKFAGRGEARRNGRLPGDHGISRPAIAQGRPSDRRHLYAAVRSFCGASSRSGPRVPAGTRSSLRPLGSEGGATEQSSGETRRENEKACLARGDVDERAMPLRHTPSLRALAKQSRISSAVGILDCFCLQGLPEQLTC